MSTPPAADVTASPPQQKLIQPDFRFFEKYGRFYGAWRRDQYLAPIDDEECHRHDLLQHFLMLARERKLCAYPFNKNPTLQCMDLGTGTAIWPVTVKQMWKNSCITAIDLNLVQPREIYDGLDFQQLNLEEPSWGTLPINHYVHVRMLLGSIKTNLWPQFYGNVYKHTTPGVGFIEQIEFDYTINWVSEQRPANSKAEEWVERYYKGMERAGRDARVNVERVRRQLEEAGFVNIRHETFRCCLGAFAGEDAENRSSRWFNYGVTMGLEAMGFIPMIEYGDLNYDQVLELSDQARTELCNMRYDAYMTMHLWLSRHPGTGPVDPPDDNSAAAVAARYMLAQRVIL